MFLGDVAEERQAEITALTLDVMAVYAERFGTIAPDFTLYIVNDEAARVAKMEEVLGDTPGLQCGLAEGNVAFIQLRCVDAAIAHEYFHVLQAVWAPKALVPESDTRWHWGAWWLFEGAAEYAEMRHGAAAFERGNAWAYATELETRRWRVSYHLSSLRELEDYAPWIATTPYDLAALAVDLLVAETSEAAMVDYFRLLPESTDWRDAFQQAFRMNTDEYYEAFAAVRAEVVPQRREVRGTLTGPDGEPVRRWRLDITAFAEDGEYWDSTDTRFDGAFLLRIPDGSYEIEVAARCGNARPYPVLGRYGGGGTLVSAHEQADRVMVSGADVEGIEIRLPAEPSEIVPVCDLGPRRTVSGTVVGPDEEPLRAVRVDAFDKEEWGALGIDGVLTDDNGSFVLHLPDGTYEYSPLVLTEADASVWPGYPYLWLSLWKDDYVLSQSVLIVDGEDVSGLRIQILSRETCYQHNLLANLAIHHGASGE